MDILLDELASGMPDLAQGLRVVLRILAATLVGALIGYERERTGKSAGLRTHMLVSLGSAIFVLATLEAGMRIDDVSRVIQGVAAGIGFIGAGAILKNADARVIEGLTTAAGIWLTAALGVAAGLGRFGLAAISGVMAWLILAVVARLEMRHGNDAT
ncbi:MAG TPA: MgtC/SapB family protein [Vicinamibacterales bacterium]|nr:MgtC/SapB family protein [Vicinamibacterales bacterium]